MEKNLYEYFACTSREELYRKVEEKDDSVRELLEYFEYVKEDLGINFIKNKINIKDQIELKEYLSKGNMPREKEISILTLDVQCRVLKDFRGSEELNNSEFIKGCYSNTGKVFILINNGCSYEKVEEVQEILDKLGLKCIDNLEIKGSNIFFPNRAEEVEWNINENWYGRNENLASYEMPEEKGIGLTSLRNYDEFLEYYIRNELNGLNIFLDEEKIIDSLKLKNQHLSQEHFSILNYDENFNIINYTIKYVGTVDRSPIESVSIIPDLVDEKVAGLIIIHNHPSGNLEPSTSDLRITKEFSDLCKIFNKNLYDHIIVSKAGSFSFRKKYLIDDISNIVREKVMRKKTNPLIEKIQTQREIKEQNINKGLTRK